MRRREALRLAGFGVVGVAAGCLGSPLDGSNETTSGPTDDSTETVPVPTD